MLSTLKTTPNFPKIKEVRIITKKIDEILPMMALI